MVRVISAPHILSAAGSPPKKIAEYIGNEVSKTSTVSIAMMNSPPGWSEPGQYPEFDEFSLVLAGNLMIRTHNEVVQVKKGELAIVLRGEWVQYSSPDGAEYIAVCVPAFSINTVHRDDEIIKNKYPHKDETVYYDEYGREGLSQIEKLWYELRDYHAGCTRYFSEDIRARNFSQRIQDLIITNEGRIMFVNLARSEQSGNIGFCVCSAADGQYGEIESIYVTSEYRSIGIGTELMKRALAWMEEMNVIELRVQVCEGNEDSFRFYERFNFFPRRHLLVQKKVSS